MINIPSMLMIGAGDRNAGKTEFVCSLISKLGSEHDITGIKVTTIETLGSGCHRGNETCGVCTKFEGNFCVTEETNDVSNKDTCRMLAAGAKKVLWLRSLKSHLKEGITALLELIGDDQIIICESNSLRNIVEPGLFLMIRNSKSDNCKPSAEKVIALADAIVLSDGKQFDIDTNSIKLIDNKWVLKMDATAIIMAGGKSRRMGQDKSMLEINGEPVIKHILKQLRPHFSQILISSDDEARYNFLDVEVVPDEDTGKGPLMGITSALRVSQKEVNFVIACDIPKVDISFVRRMVTASKGFDAVVPQIGPSKYEPLFAVYKKSILAEMDKAIAAGKYRIIDPFEYCKVKYIGLTCGTQLENLNTMKDYHKFVMKNNDVAI